MAPQQQFPYSRPGKLHFYCPLCQHHQTTNTIARITWRHQAQLVVLTLAVTVLTYPWISLACLSLYPIFWAGFEIFYRLRKRQALVCESCGFDPFLYKQDIKVARQALKRHWESRITKENLFAGKKLKNYQTSLAPVAEPSALDAAKNAADVKPEQPNAP
jgi:hypothetical protein